MKNDYRRNYFWRIRDSETGEIKRYFNLNGKMIEVSKDVFNVCYNSYLKMNREIINDSKASLISIDSFERDELTADDSESEKELIEGLYMKEKFQEIMNLISKLDQNEKDLITNLLINEKTERELARQLNLSQTAVHKRKNKILKKIKENSRK